MTIASSSRSRGGQPSASQTYAAATGANAADQATSTMPAFLSTSDSSHTATISRARNSRPASSRDDERRHVPVWTPPGRPELLRAAGRGAQSAAMRLRELHVGCLGGGTGLPSLLGGLKTNPWLQVHAIVTMFDSGGSSGVLRDELGVLPPGDVLKCALALARDEGEARRVLLTRLPTLEHRRLGGHTGGNLLLSMMEQFSGDFQAAVDGLRAVLGCRGYVWPISTERASLCAEYDDGTTTQRVKWRSMPGRPTGRFVRRVWLSPPGDDSPGGSRCAASRRRDHHRTRQLLHEPAAAAARRWRARDARRRCRARSCSSPTC